MTAIAARREEESGYRGGILAIQASPQGSAIQWPIVPQWTCAKRKSAPARFESIRCRIVPCAGSTPATRRRMQSPRGIEPFPGQNEGFDRVESIARLEGR